MITGHLVTDSIRELIQHIPGTILRQGRDMINTYVTKEKGNVAVATLLKATSPRDSWKLIDLLYHWVESKS